MEPRLTTASLLDAARSLADGGAPETARKLVAIARRRGATAAEIGPLEDHLAAREPVAGPFSDAVLADVAAIADDRTSSLTALLGAADALISWGAIDAAARALARLDAHPDLAPVVAALRMQGRQLERSGVFDAFAPGKAAGRGNRRRPHEVLLSTPPRRTGTMVVVFLGAARRFWISVYVLHHHLRRFDIDLMLLSDLTATMFLNGLAGVGGGYRGLVDMIGAAMREGGAERLLVVGSSAGGFAGLRAAADLGAEKFLGFGIRTDFSRRLATLSAYERDALARCEDPSMRMDLRAYLEQSETPRSVRLFAGDGNAVDREHATRLAALARAEIGLLDDFAAHDTLSGLMWRGELDAELRTFVDG